MAIKQLGGDGGESEPYTIIKARIGVSKKKN